MLLGVGVIAVATFILSVRKWERVSYRYKSVKCLLGCLCSRWKSRSVVECVVRLLRRRWWTNWASSQGSHRKASAISLTWRWCTSSETSSPETSVLVICRVFLLHSKTFVCLTADWTSVTLDKPIVRLVMKLFENSLNVSHSQINFFGYLDMTDMYILSKTTFYTDFQHDYLLDNKYESLHFLFKQDQHCSLDLLWFSFYNRLSGIVFFLQYLNSIFPTQLPFAAFLCVYVCMCVLTLTCRRVCWEQTRPTWREVTAAVPCGVI